MATIPQTNVSASLIQAEFGGSHPIHLNEYYGAASGIPTSGTISFGHFRGKSTSVPISVNVPNAPYKFGRTTGDLYTSLTATASGGTGSYAYVWTKVSGSTAVNISGSSSGNSVSIRCTTPGSAGTASAVFRCSVTNLNESPSTSTDSDTGTTQFEWEAINPNHL